MGPEMNSSRKYIIGASAVVLLAVSLRMLEDSASRDTPIVEPADSQPANNATALRVPVSDASTSAAHGAEQLDADWDRLSRADRIALATAEFDRAMITLELDRMDAVARERARRALTSLRPELFVDPAGAERHRELERRFEAVAE